MNRQIVLSPLTLALGAGLVLAALVIAVMATVMLTGGGDGSIPAQAGPSSPTPTMPGTPLATPSLAPAGVAATETAAPPTATSVPTAPIPPTPTPVPIVVQATAVQPTSTPTTPPPACVARVVATNYDTGGYVGSVTVMNEITGKVTTFPDRGYGMWLEGHCGATEGTCTARVIGYVRFPGGRENGTTTVVSEITGEVTSFVVTSHGGWQYGACVTG